MRIQNTVVTIMVTEMEQALSFYVDILGLSLTNRYGDHWAEIGAPGVKIGLHPSEKPVIRGENLQIGFSVANLVEAVELLNSNGVVAIIRTDGPIQLASFHDPDGNTLYFTQE